MPSLLGTRPGVHYKSLKTVNQSLKHKVNRCVLSLTFMIECRCPNQKPNADKSLVIVLQVQYKI